MYAMNNPKQMARLGVFYIQEAILDILEAEPLKPAEISRKIGIIPPGDGPALKFAIVHGVLAKLQNDRLVVKLENGDWTLAEELTQQENQRDAVLGDPPY